MYADHASTSFPTLFPVAVDRSYANPGAPHRAGRDARAALEDARRRIAAALGFRPPRGADLVFRVTISVHQLRHTHTYALFGSPESSRRNTWCSPAAGRRATTS